MTTLQQRAQAFLSRAIPPELAKKYVSGSLSELFIASSAVNGLLDAEGKAYFSECASIPAAIETETLKKLCHSCHGA